MKIYLINPPTDFLLDDRCNIPLGLLFIHSFLKDNNVNVQIIDLAGMPIEQWIIPKDGDIYGIASMTPQFEIACQIAKQIKTNTNLVVLGGVHGTCVPEESIVGNDFDLVVQHEGEEALLELSQGIPLNLIKGITYKYQGKIFSTDKRPPKKEIDEFSYPKIDSIDMESYHCGVFTTSDGDSIKGIPIITARGCPHNCAFCCSPFVNQRKVRFHSINYIRNYLAYLKEKGYKDYYIVDDTILLNKKRLTEICLIFKENDSVWRAAIRGDAATQEKLDQLYAAGCRQVDLGVESGSQRILDLVRKGERVEDNGNAIEYAHKAGIKVRACIIVGLPTETQADVDLTKEFLRKYKPDSVTLATFIPFPGCDIQRNPKQYGYVIDPKAPYSKYFFSGSSLQLSAVSSKERNAEIANFRQQLLDVIDETSLITFKVIKKRVDQLNQEANKCVQ